MSEILAQFVNTIQAFAALFGVVFVVCVLLAGIFYSQKGENNESDHN